MRQLDRIRLDPFIHLRRLFGLGQPSSHRRMFGLWPTARRCAPNFQSMPSRHIPIRAS